MQKDSEIKSIETILTSPDRNYLIVKIRTSDGLTGYGDASLNGRELGVRKILDEYIAPWLKGRDAERIEDIWQMVFRNTYWRGGPVLQTAVAGIDMALWDNKGKRHGMPVYQMLGGKSRDRVLAYFHIHGETYDELEKRALQELERKSRVLRYSFSSADPFGGEISFPQPHQDIGQNARFEQESPASEMWETEPYLNDLPRMTGRLREAVGEDIGLIHDVHSRCSIAQASRIAKELEPFHLLFLEDPLEPLQREALQHLRESSVTPLATGELFNTIDQCVPLIEKRLIDYLRLDVSHFGGITPLRKAAYLGEAYGLKTAFHGPGDISPLAHAANLHLDLHLSNFGIQEFLRHDPRVWEVFQWDFELKNGYIEIDDKAGLGVDINENAARGYPYRKGFIPALRDSSGAVHDW